MFMCIGFKGLVFSVKVFDSPVHVDQSSTRCVVGVHSDSELRVLLRHLLCLHEELDTGIAEFAIGHLTDVVAEIVDHDVGGVAHRADVLGVAIARDDGLANFWEHAHCIGFKGFVVSLTWCRRSRS